MSGEYLMAIDAGTGSCRAVIFTGDGRQVALGQREWSHPAVPGVPGSQDFDTESNWRLICACIRQSLQEAALPGTAIAAVSATSMREGMVLYDGSGDVLFACPNADGRAGAEAAKLVEQGDAARIYDVAGDWVAITAPPRLRWLARHEPATFARIAHLGMLSDWILYRLSGQFVTDASAGSSSAMFDLARRTWSAAIVDLCGIGMHMLPEVVASGTTLGRVTASTSVETGLSTATLVVVGGGDTQLGLVGLGVAAPGSVTIIGGTFWQQTLVVDTPLIDPERRLRTLCHTAPDRWMVEGIGFYSGLALRWFRDAFCEQETAVARAAGHDPYLALERLAEATPPGANGLLGLFSNMMDAKRWVHAAPSFIGFDITDPRRSGKGAFVRAILEAAAYISRTHITILSDLSGQRCSDAVFTGGAARNRLWAQMLADVLNVRIHVPSIKESTALGAALYAGVGGGLFGNIAEAAERPIDWEATYEPDPAAHAVYDAHYSRWMAAYARSLELCAARLTTPLWQAAGA